MKTSAAFAIAVFVVLTGCRRGQTGEGRSGVADSNNLNQAAAVTQALMRAGDPGPTHMSSAVSALATSPAPVADLSVGTEETVTPGPVNRRAEAIVLGYHRFVGRVRYPETEVAAADFERQMGALTNCGISVISLRDFLAWKRGEKNIPDRSAVITIDDGYKSAYTIAWPILRRHGYPFTMFIYTDYVKGGPQAGGESISWEQLAEMRDAGVDIQSHTISHRMLRAERSFAQPADYEAWLWRELAGSKAILEQRLGIKVVALAVPVGSSSSRIREMSAKAGYEAVFMTIGEKITYGTPLNVLGRYMVSAGWSNLYSEAVAFGGASCGAGEAVTRLDPKYLGTAPADGETICDRRPVIRANLRRLDGVDPASVVMRVSGVGLVEAKYDVLTRTVSCQVPGSLAESRYAVIVSARAGGRKVELRWNFTVAGEEKTVQHTENEPVVAQTTALASSPPGLLRRPSRTE